MPRFSIIVPVYNVQNYLAACVKSVAEQAGERDWECILVDDGSTDLSGQLCDALAAEIPGLRVIHRENGGLAAARNTGLQAAQGDWLLFWTVMTPWPPACWRHCAPHCPPTRSTTGSSASIWNGSRTAA